MQKFVKFVLAVGVVLVVACAFVVPCTAADREQFSVNQLSIGDPLVRITVTGTQLNNAGNGVQSLSATNITSGNMAEARLTNAAASLGDDIGGSIPVASITNAAGSLGPSIGGSVPIAAITNALSTGTYTLGGSATIPAAGLSGNIAEARLTNAFDNIIQTGGCTNDETISFSPAFTTTPILTGTWVGNPAETNADGGTAVIYIKSISASSFVLSSVVPQTNSIHWQAIQVP